MEHIVFGTVLGIILGSLVKALSDRSVSSGTFWGRSYCPHCKHKLQWYDLLPILSYLLLRGKCRYCFKKIEIEYLVVEVGMGILVGYLFWQQFQFSVFSFQFSVLLLELIFKTFFITVLAMLFLTDLKKMLIPDRVVLPAIVISVIYLISIAVLKIGYLYYSLLQTPIGQKLLPPYTDYFQRHAIYAAEPLFYAFFSAIFIGGFFWLLILITKGKGMGGGDVKLGAFMGLGLGFPNAFVALIFAFFIGAVWGLGAIIFGRKRFGQHIAFGPFLVLGSIIVLFWGPQIINWYLSLGT